jgi:hypothetical protein
LSLLFLNFLKIFFSVHEIDESTYGIKFKSGANDVFLRIELGPEFPYKIPKLTLEPCLSHPWIVNGEITQFPGIVNVS